MSTQCRTHIDIDHCCHDAVILSSMAQCFDFERTISEEDVKYLERMTVGQAENVKTSFFLLFTCSVRLLIAVYCLEAT